MLHLIMNQLDLDQENKKLDVRVAGDVVDALSIIVPDDKAVSKGREFFFVKALKELIPRQLF